MNGEEIWQRLLGSRNASIVLDAMKYLTDQRHGKPAQAVGLDVAPSADLAEAMAAACARTRRSGLRE